MSNKIVILFLSVISLMLPCNITELPINGNGIKIKLEDVSCTKACLKLTISNSQLPTTVLLLKDDSIIGDIILNRTDTLLPNTNYPLYVKGLKFPPLDLVSNKVILTTLDPTCHNFTLEKYTFGESSSSTLYDVAIIDENNIWAVGEIYLLDSLKQPDPNAYNEYIRIGVSGNFSDLCFTLFVGILTELLIQRNQFIHLMITKFLLRFEEDNL